MFLLFILCQRICNNIVSAQIVGVLYRKNNLGIHLTPSSVTLTPFLAQKSALDSSQNIVSILGATVPLCLTFAAHTKHTLTKSYV